MSDTDLANLPIPARNAWLDAEREARLDDEEARGLAALESRLAAEEDAAEARNLAAYERSLGW